MKKIIMGIIIGGMIFGAIGVIAATTISSKNVTYQDKTVNNALDELYNNVVTGKELIAAAVTSKGVNTLSTDSFEEIANKIKNIEEPVSYKVQTIELVYSPASYTANIYENDLEKFLNGNRELGNEVATLNFKASGSEVYGYTITSSGGYYDNATKFAIEFTFTNKNLRTDNKGVICTLGRSGMSSAHFYDTWRCSFVIKNDKYLTNI